MPRRSSGYPRGVWFETDPGNYRPGRSSGVTGSISHIVLHTCEGGAESCLNSLTRNRDGEHAHSAHYLVTKEGNTLQLVDELDTAWHAGAPASAYAGFRPGDLVNGVEVQRPMPNYNPNSIGIEIEGFSDDPATWTPELVAELGHLVGYLSEKYSIPLVYRDQNTFSRGSEPALAVGARPSGIVSHGTLDPARRYDPGPHFPWEAVQAAAKQYPNRQVVGFSAAPAFKQFAVWTLAALAVLAVVR